MTAARKTKQYVASSEMPLWMCERVATTTHRRECPDADRILPTYRSAMDTSHRYIDILNARLHLTDICNALTITPQDLARLWHYHNPGQIP